MAKWIGVDLDGTLAKGPGSKNVIGKPITVMLDRVKEALDSGIEVRIFTARGGTAKGVRDVRRWLDDHGLANCGITDRKDFDMTELWDDRARRVRRNSGVFCGGCSEVKFTHADLTNEQLTDC